MAPVSLKVLNGATEWVDAVNVSVSDGAGTWQQAKKVSRTDGAGNWTIVWVPLTTVTISGPAESLSQQSGSTGASPPIITPSTLTVTLGNYEPVAVVVLQSSSDAGVTWTTIKEWQAPIENVLVHDQILPTEGDWLIRAAVTHFDTRIVYSNLHSITVYTKNLTAYTTNSTPDVFEKFDLSVSCGTQCSPAPIANKWLYRMPGGGAWVNEWPAGNPQTVWQEYVNDYEWAFQEDFADGSTIYSSPVIVSSVMINHFHEIVPSGGYAEIQLAMDRASRYHELYLPIPVDYTEQSMSCVELVAGVTYDIEAEELHYRRGVRLTGNGTTIKGHGTHIFKGDNNGGGGYNSPNRDWLMHNVVFDCENNCGGLSSAHVFRYRFDGVTIKNIGGGKHHLEINSSGGPVEAGYNVEIFNSEFFQETVSSGVRTEDEAIQLDYSWDGAAPNVADDGTVTNNVRVWTCTFHELPRAFGGHVYNSQPTKADGMHSHVLFEDNILVNISPVIYGNGPNGAGSEGAVRVYYWNDVMIRNNHFQICYQPVCVYAPDNADGAAYNMGQTSILDNIYENCGGANGRHAMYGSSGGTKKIGQILCERNQIIGNWGGGPDGYFAGFDNTGGLLPNSAFSVVIRENHFAPSNFDLDGEVEYNKYRDGNSTNENGVYASGNTISDGSEHNL